jgi:hypothetical protein
MGGAALFDQNGGTLDVGGPVNGVIFTYNGGNVVTPLVLNGATLSLAAAANLADTFIFHGSQNSLVGDVPQGHTLMIEDSFSGASQLTSAAGFSNHGQIVLDTISGAGATLTISSGTLNNAANGSVGINAGVGGLTTINGHVVNGGNFTVASGATLTVPAAALFDQNGGTLDVSDTGSSPFTGATLTYNGGSISNPLVLYNATLSLAAPAPVDAADTFIFNGSQNVLAGDVAQRHTLLIRDSFGGPSQLTSAAGFSNHGQIVLDTISGAGATLTISSGTLNNAANGSVGINAGVGGLTTISGQIVNDGTVNVAAAGVLSLSAGSELTQGPSGTFSTTINACVNTFGRLTAAGSPVSLAGALRVTTVGSPTHSSTWPIISGANRSGQFATYDFGCGNFDVQYPVDGVTAVDQTDCATCLPAPSGLVSWWPGDGSAGDVQGDNDGTLQNGATFTSGAFGQGFSLDGVDDFVLVPDAPDLSIAGTLGIDAWVRIDSFPTSGAGTIVGKETASSGTNYRLDIRDNRLFFVVTFNSPAALDHSSLGTGGCDVGGCSVVGATLLTSSDLGRFLHVVAVYDDATKALIVYLDGVKDAESFFCTTGIPATNSDPLRIGDGHIVDSYLDGVIDELKLFHTTTCDPSFSKATSGVCRGCMSDPQGRVSPTVRGQR